MEIFIQPFRSLERDCEHLGNTASQRSYFVTTVVTRKVSHSEGEGSALGPFRISSEDSGDVPSYTEDSEDSLDLDMDASNSGQMNLLEEILDSLNTSVVEQGKLSTAKSLDFFRSTEELDYNSTVGRQTASVLGLGDYIS